MSLIDKLTAEIDKHYKDWAFRGSIVDWYYLNGQVIIKDFDIVTSDKFEPERVCPFWGPRTSWKFMGKAVDVFYEEDPGPKMQTIEARVERIRWLREHFPGKAAKYDALLKSYSLLSRDNIRGYVGPNTQPSEKPRSRPLERPKTSCSHRSVEPVRLMTSDLCGSRGKDLPVYSCGLHGECTHNKVCRGQDPSVRICIGCPDGPWAP